MLIETVQVHDGYSLVGVQSMWPLYAAGRPQVDGAVRRLSLLEDVFASAEIVVVDLCPDLSPQPGQRFG